MDCDGLVHRRTISGSMESVFLYISEGGYGYELDMRKNALYLSCHDDGSFAAEAPIALPKVGYRKEGINL